VNFLCDRIQKSSASGVEHSLKYSTNPVADTCDDSLQPFGPMVVLINPMEDRDQLPANGDNAKFDSINGTLSTCVANPEVNARGDYDDIVRSLDMVTYLGRYCNAASL